MRDVSYGARCARILKKIESGVMPGIQYDGGRIQRQCLSLGPVGNRFYCVESVDGAYRATQRVVKPGKRDPDESRCFENKAETLDSFEAALARATRWFLADLRDVNESVDFAMSFAEYLTEVMDAETREVENAIAVRKTKLAALKQEAEQLRRECAKQDEKVASARSDLSQRVNKLVYYLKLGERETYYLRSIKTFDKRLDAIGDIIKRRETRHG